MHGKRVDRSGSGTGNAPGAAPAPAGPIPPPVPVNLKATPARHPLLELLHQSTLSLTNKQSIQHLRV